MTPTRRVRAPLAVLLWLAAGVCGTPPPDACAPGSSTRALRYPASGTCAAVAGGVACDYQPTLVDCVPTGQVCQAGGCVAPLDPCAGVVCSTPPADTCAPGSTTVALQQPASGTCSPLSGACEYPPAPVDCALAGQVCQDGACVTPPDPCQAAGVCLTPPPPACETGTTRITFGLPAACSSPDGLPVCAYPVALREVCATGQVCQAGVCVVPPQCLVSGDCASPPADGCRTALVAQRYPNPGTCGDVGGAAACLYPPIEVDCGASDLACLAGACVSPCGAPGVCTDLPADTCAGDTVRLDYHPQGVTCASPGGAVQCSYAPAVVDCGAANQACLAGACVDPCVAPGACAPPPADSCVSARTLLHYPTTACSSPGGQVDCDYPPVQLTCPAGQVCAGGACVIDPCAIPLDGAGFLAYAAWEVATLSYDLRVVRLDGTCDQPLASGEGDDLEPSWRAAAGRIAWGGTREGNGRLVVMDLGDGVQRVLDTGPDLATSPALSADGDTLLFELRPYAATTSDLRQVPAAGGATAPYFGANSAAWTEAGWTEAGPAWSADGSQLYFVSEDRFTGWPEVWRGAAGERPTQLTSGSASSIFPEKYGLSIVGKPALSADGRWLAYTRQSKTPGSATKVVLRDLTTGTERTLSDEGDSEPAFPAAGVQVAGHDLVAVRSDRYGLYDLVLLDVGTGAVVQRLTDGTRLVGTPAFPR